MNAVHTILAPGSGRQVADGLCALAIMTKAPRAGQVKTRLTPPLTPEEAAALNVCFLRDMSAAIAETARGGRSQGVGVYTPVGAEEAFAEILPADFALVAQRGDAFGDRLRFAVEDLLAVGYASCCLINSDSPTVPQSAYAQAVAWLAEADECVVLGPSDDGGYYLIGLKKMHQRLFEEIDWSTERVFEQTMDRARELALPVKLLPTCYDVDERVTLRRLCDDVMSDGSAAKETKRFLSALIAREGACAYLFADIMSNGTNGKRALVTGGAGLIGSHLTDLLVREGWRVRIFDNLEPNTHKLGKPAWVNPDAEFVQGDMRNRADITAALDDIDVVFHEAAYGGYMPEIAKYVHVNSLGTAQMLEVIREENLPIKKVIVASSQAVYSEGAAECAEHGFVYPNVRPIEQLRAGDWAVHCPLCGAVTRSVPTPEEAPVGGETVYGLTKVDQEKLVLLWGKQAGIPTVALALFLHLRPAPIDLQSLHRRDRDLLHAPAQRPPARALRRRRTNA